VVDRILVESRACIQPYFTAPSVRTLGPSRRRTDTRTNLGIPSASLWVTTQGWGRGESRTMPGRALAHRLPTP
jgi:hypothetical protein